MNTDKLQDYLSDIWRTADKTMDAADSIWSSFIELVEQEGVDYYVAKTLKQRIKTEVKDALEYAEKLTKLLQDLNRKIGEK